MLLLSSRLYIFLWVVVSPCANLAESSHFEGASVSWRPGKIYKEEDIYEILVDFRVAWRRSTALDSPSTYCDENDVKAGKTIWHGNSEAYEWTCRSGCNGTVASAEVTCTEFDEDDDWSVGFRTARFNITEPESNFTIEFYGCCWISTLVYATNDPAEWSIEMNGSVGIRSDTEIPNRSPISAATPIIRFQAGCPDFVDLLLYDADGDNVTCRFAECGGPSCAVYPYLKLTQQGQKCRLSYNAGGPDNTNVAISIVLEDFPMKDDLQVNKVLQDKSAPLSAVSLQFIVKLYKNLGRCSVRPKWIDPTFPNGLLKTAPVGQNMTVELGIESTTSLGVVKVVGPIGLTALPATNISETKYTSALLFNASEDQVGSHIVCITAKDTNGKMSEQRCMVLIVGEGTPCDVDNGGCSEVCEVAGNSYRCACERDCWRLADDKRTCIPNIEVECKTDRFTIDLPECAVSTSTVTIGYDYAGLGISSAPCEADLRGNSFIKEVKYDECSTETESDFSEVHYWNHVRMFVDEAQSFPGSGDNQITITRGYYYNMQIVCSFSKYANVNASFRPQDREEGLVRVPGLGSFQFFFDFFVDEHFGAAYSPYEYPITVTVNSDIYFGIRTVGGTGLQVFTEKCVAMTTPTQTDNTILYTIIQDGCFSDTTLKRHTAPSAMEDRFSIKAFRFQDNLNVDQESNIYIQCTAVLCVVGDPTTRCQKGCITSRKRRDGEEEIFLDRQKRTVDDEKEPTTSPNVSESQLLDIEVSGPFRIHVEHTEGTPLVTVATPDASASTKRTLTVTKKEVKEDEEPNSIMVVVIASSVGAVLFILFLVVLISLVVYYHLVLQPRHKVLPDKEVTPRSMSAWTLDGRENLEMPPIKPETPPPLYSEIEHQS